MTTRTKTIYALAILFAINALNFFDRQVFGAIAEPVRKEWGLSDSAIGLIGTAFTLVYAAVGRLFFHEVHLQRSRRQATDGKVGRRRAEARVVRRISRSIVHGSQRSKCQSGDVALLSRDTDVP